MGGSASRSLDTYPHLVRDGVPAGLLHALDDVHHRVSYPCAQVDGRASDARVSQLH